VRAAAPPALTPEAMQAQCMTLKNIVAALEKDVVWLRQPYSEREVQDVKRHMTALGCAIGGLEGTWTVTGVVPKGLTALTASDYRETLTLVLKAVDRDTGIAEADKRYGPLTSGDFMCRRADVFYTGTMTYSSDPPWKTAQRTANVIACGNQQNPLSSIAGRFGVVEGSGVSSRFGGGFIILPDAPGVMHGNRIVFGGTEPQAEWDLKKVN
jgi:hypothetical protein